MKSKLDKPKIIFTFNCSKFQIAVTQNSSPPVFRAAILDIGGSPICKTGDLLPDQLSAVAIAAKNAAAMIEHLENGGQVEKWYLGASPYSPPNPV